MSNELTLPEIFHNNKYYPKKNYEFENRYKEKVDELSSRRFDNVPVNYDAIRQRFMRKNIKCYDSVSYRYENDIKEPMSPPESFKKILYRDSNRSFKLVNSYKGNQALDFNINRSNSPFMSKEFSPNGRYYEVKNCPITKYSEAVARNIKLLGGKKVSKS